MCTTTQIETQLLQLPNSNFPLLLPLSLLAFLLSKFFSCCVCLVSTAKTAFLPYRYDSSKFSVTSFLVVSSPNDVSCCMVLSEVEFGKLSALTITRNRMLTQPSTVRKSIVNSENAEKTGIIIYDYTQ